MSKRAQPDAVYQAVFNMLDEAILPALNMVSANCCLAEEIWKLIRHLPYEHRQVFISLSALPSPIQFMHMIPNSNSIQCLNNPFFSTKHTPA